jgi:hypothetical protein
MATVSPMISIRLCLTQRTATAQRFHHILGRNEMGMATFLFVMWCELPL